MNADRLDELAELIRQGLARPTVQHCNARTGYELIVHDYDPDECRQCDELRDLVGGR